MKCILCPKNKAGCPKPLLMKTSLCLKILYIKMTNQECLKKLGSLSEDYFRKWTSKKWIQLVLAKKSGNETKIVSFGEKGGESEIFKGRRGVLKSFTDNFKDTLGPKAAKIIDKDNASIREVRQRLREAQKQLNEMETNAVQLQRTKDDLQHVRNRIEQTRARIDGQNKDQILKVKANCKD